MLSFFRRRPSRMLLASWLAVCAMLLGTLAPAVSGVLAVRDGLPFPIELCTADGLISPDDPVSHDSPVMGSHCPYCLTHAGSFALPVDLGGHSFSSSLTDAWSWALVLSPWSLRAHDMLRARGPPVHA